MAEACPSLQLVVTRSHWARTKPRASSAAAATGSEAAGDAQQQQSTAGVTPMAGLFAMKVSLSTRHKLASSSLLINTLHLPIHCPMEARSTHQPHTLPPTTCMRPPNLRPCCYQQVNPLPPPVAWGLFHGVARTGSDMARRLCAGCGGLPGPTIMLAHLYGALTGGWCGCGCGCMHEGPGAEVPHHRSIVTGYKVADACNGAETHTRLKLARLCLPPQTPAGWRVRWRAQR